MTQDSVLFGSKDEWIAWLHEQHARSTGLWLRFAKKGESTPSISYAEALDVALCYGWIDAQKKPGPTGFWLQRFTPRGKRSIWSQVNRAKALALLEAGAMQPAGWAAVERAKTTGQWDKAYQAVSTATVPDDLAKELKKDRQASEFFEQLSSQNRYAILFRLQTAKKAETRAKRLATFVEMLREGKTIHPQRTGTKRVPTKEKD